MSQQQNAEACRDQLNGHDSYATWYALLYAYAQMTAVQIQTLLQPPNASLANERALEQLNNWYTSLDDLHDGDKLSSRLHEAERTSKDLDEQVRVLANSIAARVQTLSA